MGSLIPLVRLVLEEKKRSERLSVWSTNTFQEWKVMRFFSGAIAGFVRVECAIVALDVAQQLF